MAEKTKALDGFLPLLKARLKYLNGSKGNIQPFVFLPHIWSFAESPETVNQKLCTWGTRGRGKTGANGPQGGRAKRFDVLRA